MKSLRRFAGGADHGPFGVHVVDAPQQELAESACLFDLSEHWLGDFCGFSYGFRPGRGPHDALDALCTAIEKRRVNWIVDTDIQNFFGAVSQKWLVRFLEHRIGDKHHPPDPEMAEGGYIRRRDRDRR